MSKFGHYRPENLFGWAFATTSFGLLSMITVSSPRSWQIGFQVICGIGIGVLFTSTTFPILAPLPISETAHALSLFTFVRCLAEAFGVTIGSTILQNELKKQLPEAFVATVSGSVASGRGAAIAYSVIPIIGTLPEPLRDQVRSAFAESMRVLWRVLIGVSAMGALCVFGMKELPMHETTDQEWGMAHDKGSDVEKARG